MLMCPSRLCLVNESEKSKEHDFWSFYLPGQDALIKNLFMLSVRISSYGCTREVWRARKMRKSCTRLSPRATLAS